MYKFALILALLTPHAVYAVSHCGNNHNLVTEIAPDFACTKKAAHQIVSDCMKLQENTIHDLKIKNIDTMKIEEISFFARYKNSDSDMFAIFTLDSKTCDFKEVGGTECRFLLDQAWVRQNWKNLSPEAITLCRTL